MLAITNPRLHRLISEHPDAFYQWADVDEDVQGPDQKIKVTGESDDFKQEPGEDSEDEEEEENEKEEEEKAKISADEEKTIERV